MSKNKRQIVIPKLANEYGVDKQSTKILQSSLNIVTRILDFIAQKNSLSTIIRSNKGTRNFICSPAMNTAPATVASVITANNAICNRPAVFNIFLDMFSSMVPLGNIFTPTMRTVVKVNVNGFIGLFRFSAEPSRMTSWSTTLFHGHCNSFAFFLSNRIFENIREFCFELRVSIFKFFNALLKFKSLTIADIHGGFEFVNPFAKLVSFCDNMLMVFAIKKNTEIPLVAIMAFNFSGTASRVVMPHGVSCGELIKSRRTSNKYSNSCLRVYEIFSVNENFSKNHNTLTMEAL